MRAALAVSLLGPPGAAVVVVVVVVAVRVAVAPARAAARVTRELGGMGTGWAAGLRLRGVVAVAGFLGLGFTAVRGVVLDLALGLALVAGVGAAGNGDAGAGAGASAGAGGAGLFATAFGGLAGRHDSLERPECLLLGAEEAAVLTEVRRLRRAFSGSE